MLTTEPATHMLSGEFATPLHPSTDRRVCGMCQSCPPPALMTGRLCIGCVGRGGDIDLATGLSSTDMSELLIMSVGMLQPQLLLAQVLWRCDAKGFALVRQA